MIRKDLAAYFKNDAQLTVMLGGPNKVFLEIAQDDVKSPMLMFEIAGGDRRATSDRWDEERRDLLLVTIVAKNTSADYSALYQIRRRVELLLNELRGKKIGESRVTCLELVKTPDFQVHELKHDILFNLEFEICWSPCYN